MTNILISSGEGWKGHFIIKKSKRNIILGKSIKLKTSGTVDWELLSEIYKLVST